MDSQSVQSAHLWMDSGLWRSLCCALEDQSSIYPRRRCPLDQRARRRCPLGQSDHFLRVFCVASRIGILDRRARGLTCNRRLRNQKPPNCLGGQPSVVSRQSSAVGHGRYFSGFTAFPFTLTVKCRCTPVEKPPPLRSNVLPI
jgi:hypothetical protein